MNRRQGGFTLVELVVVLVISAMLIGFGAAFINMPIQTHLAQARRGELAASAEMLTQWMSQDVRRALPNSVRTGLVGGRAVVEMIAFAGIGIYRDAGAEGDTLDFLAPDNQFDILGLPSAPASHIVVANLGTPGRDAYALANVIAPAGINVASSRITLAPPMQFAGASMHRRAYFVSPAAAVVRYECDVVARTLRRYDNLPVTAGIGALAAGASSQLIASDISACTFTPVAGTADHGGLLLIRFTVQRITNGATESLRIMKQLKVEDAA